MQFRNTSKTMQLTLQREKHSKTRLHFTLQNERVQPSAGCIFAPDVAKKITKNLLCLGCEGNIRDTDVSLRKSGRYAKLYRSVVGEVQRLI